VTPRESLLLQSPGGSGGRVSKDAGQGAWCLAHVPGLLVFVSVIGHHCSLVEGSSMQCM
jgi:hypothetical protein